MAGSNIILTGFMGTGKTTVGKMLAKELGYTFVDTDELIVERAGMSVAQIFEQRGEEAFRKMESDMARELSRKQDLVVSTGGRMMLDPGNAEALSSSGQVFCLVATPEEIVERVRRDTRVKRPLLDTPNPMQRVVGLMKQREDGYGQFPQMLTSEKTPDQVTANLMGIIQANPDLRLSITASDMRYEYIVGAGILPFIRELAGIRGAMAVVTDTMVGARYVKSIPGADAVIEIEPGQRNKTLATVESVCETLVDKGFDRSGTIVALGGSVISNLAGFVAATYMRGVDLVQCPTSLLAMADTSIGGKAGINLPQGKNLIGAFKQPKAVIADVATLQSLSSEKFTGGMAEIIKHGLIGGRELFSRIKERRWRLQGSRLYSDLAELQGLVAQAIQVKIGIVQEDPYERGRRAVLNLGHTFAHAIEQASDHSIGHGAAVAMGLVAAANLSAQLGHCTAALQEEVEAVLDACGLPLRIPSSVPVDKILSAIRLDKKKKGGRLNFVLLKDVGQVFVTDQVTTGQVTLTLEAMAEN